MIIWSGAGILVIVIVAIVFVLTEGALNAAFGSRYCATHPWTTLVALALAAAVLWPYGRWLNAGEEKEWVDPDTGHRVVHQVGGGGHSLFFIPVEYWAVICVVFGLVMLFK